MRLFRTIVFGLVVIATVAPAAAQTCGTFRRCPVTRTVSDAERCWAFYRVSAGSFSKEETDPIKTRCEQIEAAEIAAMGKGPINLGPPSFLDPSPPDRIDELEQQVEDLQERIEELEAD